MLFLQKLYTFWLFFRFTQKQLKRSCGSVPHFLTFHAGNPGSIPGRVTNRPTHMRQHVCCCRL
jgi:hypothetical protein